MLKRQDRSKKLKIAYFVSLKRNNFSYRAIVLRALPNLQKLDNVDVTPEELDRNSIPSSPSMKYFKRCMHALSFPCVTFFDFFKDLYTKSI